jgi:hypothetical protein
MVRPAALLELLDEDDEDDVDDEEVDDELEEDDDEVVLVDPPGSSPDPPQAVRESARASPAAYEIGTRSVIFVTNPSVDSAI